jgi:signal peptidase I
MEGDEQAEGSRDEGTPDEAHDEGEPPKDRPHSARWIVEIVGVVVVAILVALLLRTFVVATYSIPSGSMEPTLQIGDRIVVDKLSYHLHGIGRGDIVVFSTPPTENCAGPPVADLVKRVIGLPGEIISLDDGNVYINGRLLPEPFLPPALRDDTYPGPSTAPYALHRAYRIPPGDVFVMGDNRPESCDSRYWGPIRKSTIVGKVDMRIWPLSRIGFF